MITVKPFVKKSKPQYTPAEVKTGAFIIKNNEFHGYPNDTVFIANPIEGVALFSLCGNYILMRNNHEAILEEVNLTVTVEI